MTKKDYKMLANVIAATREDNILNVEGLGHADETIERLLNRLCRALKQDNSRFDEQKFREAVYR